jgi:hypothetical protein
MAALSVETELLEVPIETSTDLPLIWMNFLLESSSAQ